MTRQFRSRRLSFSLALAAALGVAPAAGQQPTSDAYRAWQQHGECWILTDAEGADLPTAASVVDFPLLLRLQRGMFEFAQAQPHGEDLRVTDDTGQPLHFEIEQWDAAAGAAAIWVRVPRIQGGARQRLRLHWGNPAAKSGSDGSRVFGPFNGYVTALHLDPSLRDAVGSVTLQDEGTSSIVGMIGEARHLNGRSGLFGGDKLEGFPVGAGDSTSEVWFRPERANATVFAWGQEQRPGKVMFNLLSPPHMAIQCYFADVDSKQPVAMGEWIHVVHTYRRNDSRIYIDGELAGASTPLLDLPKLVRLHIGGWHGHGFRGDVDEVRVSNVVRSPEWIELQFANQRALQTLVGPIVAGGSAFAASVPALRVDEGGRATVTAQAGGAQKLTWWLQRDGKQTVFAVDRLEVAFAPGRVTGEQSMALQLRAVFADAVRTLDVPITVAEAVPDPDFALPAPATWDGRKELRLTPAVAKAAALTSARADELRAVWRLDGLATVHHVDGTTLVLERSQRSGPLTVQLSLDNGGAVVTRAVTIAVTEPARDPYVEPPATDDLPVDHRFYARRPGGEGTLVCRGELTEAADQVFVRVLADGKPYRDVRGTPGTRGTQRCYDLTVPLEARLVRYTAEIGIVQGGAEKILRTAKDLVCGDVFVIDGQSNALATDFGEPAPTYTSEWIRTFGSTAGDADAARTPVWGNAVCRAERGMLEIGVWALELGRRWVAAHQVPVCIVNGAVGGTRIDQHQRNEQDPTDVDTIYGRLLWRLREAKLTHGVRAILWHQGENDQGADGPTGRYGWETYRDNFVAMAAGWRRDYPNVEHTYVFQIWPKACAMGVDGSDNMLRQVQRTLPRWFARMSSMSTLGIRPEGGCHYPLAGWAEFARLIQPLLERDLLGLTPGASITPPDLLRAHFADAERRRIVLAFDQPVVWSESLRSEFTLDGARDQVVKGEAVGDTLVLELKAATTAAAITYLDSAHWQPENLLRGANGIAALTFCAVPIEPAPGK